jgi:hypothetical protein
MSVLRVADADGENPCCIFDLDSTLLNSRGRSLRILEKFAAVQGQRFPGLAERVRSIQHDELGYSVFSALEGTDFLTPLLRRDLKRFWGKRFFSSCWCEADFPIPGAPDYVRACRSAGASILYVTARDTPQMEEGTRRCLEREGFPRPGDPQVELHMKPPGTGGDENFKAVAIREIQRRDLKVVATFENEPGNANLFAAGFPEALHFLLETVHSPNAEAPSDSLIATPDFLSS